MDRLQYLDFELKIEREGDRYSARVLRSPAGEASGTFTLPFSEDRLALLVLKLGQLRSGTRAIRSQEIEAARELGGKLFEAVFNGEVRASLRSSLDEVQRQEGTGLRLKLRLQEAAELADLPWEYLYDPSLDRFIAQSNQTPIVRYIEMPERIKPFAVQLPLQVLVMVSSPDDPNYIKLDVERESAMLRQALDPLHRTGHVRLEWLERATLSALQRSLQGGPYHIFHYIGHGGFDKRTEEGVLVLEDEQRRGWLADGHRIGTLMHDHRSLRLVVLNSCEGARNSKTDPFAGVATTIIRQGIPAVVAMQFEITDDAAITFAGEFYAALARGFPVDAAVAEGRKAVYLKPNDVEWGTPVLYTRAPDGALFEVTGSPQPQSGQVVQPEAPRQRPPEPDQPVQPDALRPPQPEAPHGATPPLRLPQVPASMSAAAQSLAGLYSIKQERTALIDASPETLRERVMKWANAQGFTCANETLQRWEFSRGKLLSTLVAFKIENFPLKVVVQMMPDPPGTVYASVEVLGRGKFSIFGASDRKYLSDRLDLLMAHLAGTR